MASLTKVLRDAPEWGALLELFRNDVHPDHTNDVIDRLANDLAIRVSNNAQNIAGDMGLAVRASLMDEALQQEKRDREAAEHAALHEQRRREHVEAQRDRYREQATAVAGIILDLVSRGVLTIESTEPE